MRRYCAKWCSDAALGEELAQEVFLDLWRARARYRPDTAFASYLFTLARNRCRSAGRRRASAQKGAADVPASSPSPDQLGELLLRERQRRVDSGIAALTPKLREALLLRFGAELDYRQVADVLGISEVTARSRVFEAVAKLRQIVGDPK